MFKSSFRSEGRWNVAIDFDFALSIIHYHLDQAYQFVLYVDFFMAEVRQWKQHAVQRYVGNIFVILIDV